jgi:hypothetical protein
MGFERETTLARFVAGYARLLVADLDDAALADPIAPGANHPAWILGHLAIATDYARQQLGLPAACPEAWHRRFGPGSTPEPDRALYPPKAELLAALEAGIAGVLDALPGADPAAMAAPHGVPIAFLRDAVPTRADLLAHLLTTHPAVHLGQLSLWRRARGLPGVLAL